MNRKCYYIELALKLVKLLKIKNIFFILRVCAFELSLREPNLTALFIKCVKKIIINVISLYFNLSLATKKKMENNSKLFPLSNQ